MSNPEQCFAGFQSFLDIVQGVEADITTQNRQDLMVLARAFGFPSQIELLHFQQTGATPKLRSERTQMISIIEQALNPSCLTSSCNSGLLSRQEPYHASHSGPPSDP
jgi:hypothetical protein